MKERKIFRRLLSPEEALARLSEHVKLKPLGAEEVPIEEAVGRVLAEDVVAQVDVPPFDRSTRDGYAVRVEDVAGATEDTPARLKFLGTVEAGEAPGAVVESGCCVEVATGAMLPRGAEAVVMVEYTKRCGDVVEFYRGASPGENIAYAGSDAVKGEIIAWKGDIVTPQLVGALASAGIRRVKVYRKPKVAIFATGNELVEPGEPLELAQIYNSNAYMIAAAVKELGCEPIILGIARDDPNEIRRFIEKGLSVADVVISSGSTSAGPTDVMYRLAEELGTLIAHGLRIKPGKPTVIAVINGKIFFGLPGFPMSCLVAFKLVVAPALARISGVRIHAEKVKAKLAERIYGATGQRLLAPVTIVPSSNGLLAVPVPGDSGSIVKLSMSDGFVEVPENKIYLEEGEEVDVTLLSRYRAPDLVYVGSHCPLLDKLLSALVAKGFHVKRIYVGSTAGLKALKKGYADIAGLHLYDPATGKYNEPFVKAYNLEDRIVLVTPYVREQGFIVAKGNPHNIKSLWDIAEKGLLFINRNKGSGTRALAEHLLAVEAGKHGLRPEELASRIKGWNTAARTHQAVALAVKHGRADAGLGVRYVAELYGLGFVPVKDEEFALAFNKASLSKPAVKLLYELLVSDYARSLAKAMPGYEPLT